MKQKGKRFYVEEKPKKKKVTAEKPLVKEIEVDLDAEINEADNSAVQVNEHVESTSAEGSKSEKNRAKEKAKITKQLEKKRTKALKKVNKSSKKSDVSADSSDASSQKSGKVLQFKTNENNTRFEKFVKTVRLNKKSIVMCAVIILILSLSVLIFANRDRLSFSSIKNFVEYGVMNREGDEHFPIATNGDIITNGNFSRIDRNLVFVSDTKFATLNNYGRTIFESSHGYSTPVLAKASDSDLSLMYNLGGKGFSVSTLDSLVYTGEAEDNIIVADISKSGTYALVTEKDGYLSKLYVYSEDNKQIFAYSFADYYITSVSLDSKGDCAVLTGLSAHDGTQYSAVYLLDFNKEEPVVFKEFEDNILYYASHLTNNYVSIIGDTAAYTLNTITKSFNTFSYEGKSLTAFDVDTDTNTFTLSLSRSGDGRKCDILVFSTSGSLRETISTELKVTALSTYKNRIGVLSSGNVHLYSKDGNFISETNAGLDPHSLVLYSTTDAYILGVSEIRRIDL
ncbi:MAG: hypothetical protein IJ015_06125 [Ruminococcus sp.]|nr:hypothetical protein [Ruminococcus sp.]